MSKLPFITQYVLRFLEMIKMAAKNKISFYYLTKAFFFPGRTSIKNNLVKLFSLEEKPLDNLTYVFCDDEYLLEINRSFLRHDYYTDIITFNLADKGKPVIGEIYISVERVRDNAALLHESFNRELKRVLFHGALHLCGYRDKKLSEKNVMRIMEEHYLSM